VNGRNLGKIWDKLKKKNPTGTHEELGSESAFVIEDNT